MVRGDTVLRCLRCNKPFNKESTLKRHDYYCRTRNRDPVCRSWSCKECVKQKLRCDNLRPSCSRCAKKERPCVYPTHSRPRNDQAAQSPRPVISLDDNPSNPSPLAVGNFLAHDDGRPNTDELSLNVGGGLAFDPVVEAIPSDMVDFDANWSVAHLEATDVFNSAFQHPEFGMNKYMQAPFGPSTYQAPDLQAFGLPTTSVPQPFPYRFRSFLARHDMQTGSTSRTLRLILQTLKSYPLMMLRGKNTLPPFIHPRLASAILDDEDDEMEPLNNCISLLQLLSSGIPGSKKLFWRTVRNECERYSKQDQAMNRWYLLACLQALIIYVVARLGEGQQEYSNVDKELVAAVSVITTRLRTVSMPTDSQSNQQDLDWKDWIFEESVRRICVVFATVNMLFFFEPLALCHLRDVGLIFGPLPAKKLLWEAENEATWCKRVNDERSTAGSSSGNENHVFVMSVKGDLVKVSASYKDNVDQSRRAFCCRSEDGGLASLNRPGVSEDTASWDEWCSEMDGLGSLVMLAAAVAV